MNEYRCPKDCACRSADCHIYCERHFKFQQSSEKKRAEKQRTDALTKGLYHLEKVRSIRISKKVMI